MRPTAATCPQNKAADKNRYCSGCGYANIHHGVCGWCDTPAPAATLSTAKEPPPTATIVAGMTQRTFLTVMHRLEAQPWVYPDQVPGVAQKALATFCDGLTLNWQAGRPALSTQQFRQFAYYVVHQGLFPYPVRWDHDPQP